MSTVYTLFCTDVIHEGHLNIINKARELGDLTVGVLNDDAMIRYNRFPTLSLEERVELVKGIEGVKDVIVQNSVMYDEIFETLKPDFVVHGDNWGDAAMQTIKANIEKNIEKYGGKLVEIPYTYNENVKKIDDRMMEKLALPDFRRARLKKVLGMTFVPGSTILSTRFSP